jgi:hypothetical protein
VQKHYSNLSSSAGLCALSVLSLFCCLLSFNSKLFFAFFILPARRRRVNPVLFLFVFFCFNPGAFCFLLSCLSATICVQNFVLFFVLLCFCGEFLLVLHKDFGVFVIEGIRVIRVGDSQFINFFLKVLFGVLSRLDLSACKIDYINLSFCGIYTVRIRVY